MGDIAIRVEHLSKMYRLGVINNGTLWKDLQTWVALKTGHEDPHSKIGEDKYSGDADHFWALKDVSFEIKQGDRIGIIGKNGAGKSTLLKILSRITAPTEGVVKINGKITSLLEVGTGFNGELTGRENIYLNGAILGMKKRQIDRRLDAIIDFSGIERHIDTPVKRYSSGMYVRLAFAVAAHLESRILIADEVLAVGDAEFQKKAIGKMHDVSTGEGKTVLFVSHQMAAVRSLCNKGIILEKGRILRTEDVIDDAISYYLGTSEAGDQLRTTVWDNDESFANMYFQPMHLEVSDLEGNTVRGGLDYDEEYRVRLQAKIGTLNPIMNFWISVFRDNVELLDVGLQNEQPLPPGVSDFEFSIPKRSLLPGYYRFCVGSSLQNTQWILNPAEGLVSIKVLIQKNDDTAIFPGRKV